MKIDFSKAVTNVDGSELQEKLTLKDASVNALINMIEGDAKLTPKEKFDLGILAQKIATSPNGDIEVSSEEITILKDRIGRAYSPVVVLFAWNVFESATTG